MDAKAYAARNRQGSDWFGHSAETTIAPTQHHQNHNNVEQDDAPLSSRTQLIRPVCNSNQWFKHAENESVTDAPKKVEVEHQQPQQQQQQTPVQPQPQEHPLEVVVEKKDPPSQSTCGSLCFGASKSTDEPKTRAHTKEAEANCTRDKTGSDWFSHDNQGSRPTSSMSGSRIGSVEGSNNASRMRGESENWFSHDPNAPSQPLHASKGRQLNQKQNHDMFNVFHHDQ